MPPLEPTDAAAEEGVPEHRIDELLRLGTEAWNEFSRRRQGTFHTFIPADQREAYGELLRLRGRASSFLELGSGVGVITVLADLLGYDAYGIEIEPELVAASEDLAARLDSGATFVSGSFVPPDYRDEVDLLPGDWVTVCEGADAYEELGMDLSDFDLVYAYPWPGEEDWLSELVRRHAGPHTTLLTYVAGEGFLVSQPGG
ncbi:MAG: hypothetical protein AAF682_21140 [Planctomycetota bacterium]